MLIYETADKHLTLPSVVATVFPLLQEIKFHFVTQIQRILFKIAQLSGKTNVNSSASLRCEKIIIKFLLIEQVSNQCHGFRVIICMLPVLAQHPVYFGQVPTGVLPEKKEFVINNY